MTAVVQRLELGDVEGHPFRGNQYSDVLEGIDLAPRVKRGFEPDFDSERHGFAPNGPVNGFTTDRHTSASLEIGGYDADGRLVSTFSVVTDGPDDGAFKVSVRTDAQRQGQGMRILEEAERQGVDLAALAHRQTYTSEGRALLAAYITKKGMTAAGDLPGHPFRGNQWTHSDGREGAPQRASKFVGPDGEPLTRSQIGDTMEALAATHPAISSALSARFGGEVVPVVGHQAGHVRQGPWDLRVGDTAIELKSVHASSTTQKATLKRDEIEDKTAAIAAAGLKAGTAAIVFEPTGDSARVHLYAIDGIVSGTLKKFDALGVFDVSAAEFAAAYQTAGYE